MSLYSKFRNNLQKTSNFLSSNILSSFKNKKVDNETLEDLESILISADISLDVVEKLMFSCREADDIFRDWAEGSIRKILICGIETHVCIQQTVLDLLSEGFRVYLAVDAIGARHALDHQIALRRMESSGAVLTTTEAAMFEWCESAANPKFKTISHLVREARPTDAE